MIINGPNLNLLGKREPEVYGSQTFEDYLAVLQTSIPRSSITLFQSNGEGKLIDKIHEIGFTYDGIILNAGGVYTYLSGISRCSKSSIYTSGRGAYIKYFCS